MSNPILAEEKSFKPTSENSIQSSDLEVFLKHLAFCNLFLRLRNFPPHYLVVAIVLNCAYTNLIAVPEVSATESVSCSHCSASIKIRRTLVGKKVTASLIVV